MRNLSFLMKPSLLIVVTAFLIAPAHAVELKLKWQTGKQYRFEQSSDSSAKVPLPGQGMVESKSKMVIGMQHTVGAHEKGSKVSVAFDGLRMKIEMAGIAFEFDSEDPTKPAGPLGPVLQPLADAKYEAIYGKDGALLEVLGLDKIEAPGELGVGLGKDELEAMARQASDFMPGKDVQVGETWTAEVKLPMGGLGEDEVIVYTLKLEAVEVRDDQELARVSMTGALKQREPAADAVLAVEAKEISGLMFFDLKLGQPREYRSTMDLEVALPAGVPVEEGAPGKMPMRTVTVQRLIEVKDLPAGGR